MSRRRMPPDSKLLRVRDLTLDGLHAAAIAERLGVSLVAVRVNQHKLRERGDLPQLARNVTGLLLQVEPDVFDTLAREARRPGRCGTAAGLAADLLTLLARDSMINGVMDDGAGA